MRIIHTCSSALVRPNGIVRYINTVLYQQEAVDQHSVVFISDARPTQTIGARGAYLPTRLVYADEESQYDPGWHPTEEHVWLQVDPVLVTKLAGLIREEMRQRPADLVIAHDLMSYLAAVEAGVPAGRGVFIQHESDILTLGSRYSYMSDEWLEEQRRVVNTTDWRIGMTVPSTAISPRHPVRLPVPFVMPRYLEPPKHNKPHLLYVGDASERKGAREFMDMARTLRVVPTVISHEPSPIFEGAEFYQFGLDQQAEMYEVMRQHRVAFIPSRNECPGIAVLECLQFMPVVLCGEYAWTQYHKDTGADIIVGREARAQQLERYLLDTWLDSRFWRQSGPGKQLELWCEQAKECWHALKPLD